MSSLPAPLLDDQPENGPGMIASAPSLREVTSEYARLVYEATGHNKARAAEILGVNVVTVYRMAKKWEDGGPGALETDLGAILLEKIKARALMVEAQDTLEALLDKFDGHLRKEPRERKNGDDRQAAGREQRGLQGGE